MKQASSATLAILATGEYQLAELYAITLVTGQQYRFTNYPIPLTAAVYPSGTKNTYQTGLTIMRDTITQKVGVEAGNMKVKLSPQWDSPNAPVLIAGYPLWQAASLGFLDGATVGMSKLFMATPAAGSQLDTSPGAVGWFLGAVQEVELDRLTVELTIDDYLAFLGNQQMPRQLFQAGCFHQVYDAGCTLLASAFTVTGSVSAVTDASHFTSGLTQADDYFDLGVLTFTSGVNNGLSANVNTFKHASGSFAFRFPFPVAPSPGDTFKVYPGCDLTQATCSSKFSNLAHFSGMPYIPVPETILDGGVDNPPTQAIGAQAGQMISSLPTGQSNLGPYHP